MQKVNRIRTGATESREVVRYGVTKRLFDVTGETNSVRYFRDDIDLILVDPQAELQLESRSIQAAVAEILMLEGVVSVVVRTYEVQVEIGLAFDWTETNSAVISILERLFEGESVDVEDGAFSPFSKSNWFGGSQ